MTTVTGSYGTTRETGRAATVEVAGISWPTYKLHALLLAVVVAIGVLVLSGSGQIAMWASAITMLTVWWGERLLSARLHR